jgi:GAF domain-containing protein
MSLKFFSQAETDKDIYEELLPQVEELLDKNEHWVTNLSNLSALLKQAFSKISWVGFYLFDGEKLILGPFQGKVACTFIHIGKGVCGTSAEQRKTILVPNVHEFPGHIACDDASNSEIVVPLLRNDELIGVLDLDSTQLSAFNETDKQYLEKICKFICYNVLDNYKL